MGLDRNATVLAALLGAAGLALACCAFALAGMGPNPANSSRLIDKPLEGYRYDRAERCNRHVPPGTRALKKWLAAHTRGSFWGSYRCEKLSRGNFSLHSENRAIDWAMDARKRKYRHQAMRLIRERLLAPDRRGRPHALARRMGIQGIIYDCRSWWSGQSRLGRYSYCYTDGGRRKKHLDRTAAHMDHIHIELNWPGARKRTSFWESGRGS